MTPTMLQIETQETLTSLRQPKVVLFPLPSIVVFVGLYRERRC